MKKSILLLMLCCCLLGCRVENDVNYDSVGLDVSDVDDGDVNEEYDDGALPVPEPATVVLLGVVMIGFLLYEGFFNRVNN